ncbi:hypothetical protein [Streptomyces yanii]|uniref:Uncharacterized protein n=1 Tax=Streptomyces yanii TaxID=78510 RepID=A0ABV5RK58_9ACTN
MTVLSARHSAVILTLASAMLLPTSLAAAAPPAPADQGATSAHAEVGDPSRETLRLLAQSPFPPTDLSLLTTGAYPDGPPVEPAPPREITVRELTKQLKATLKPRGRRAIEGGLAAFHNPQIIAVMPDPNLRAALASLAGSPVQHPSDPRQSLLAGDLRHYTESECDRSGHRC